MLPLGFPSLAYDNSIIRQKNIVKYFWGCEGHHPAQVQTVLRIFFVKLAYLHYNFRFLTLYDNTSLSKYDWSNFLKILLNYFAFPLICERISIVL